MSEEHGSLAAFLAVLAAGLFVLVGLVVDGGRAMAAQRRAVDVAQQAARLGADQLSVDGLRSGTFVVSPEQATEAVDRYLAAAAESGSVSVAGDKVTVQISTSAPTVVLGIVGINALPVSAVAVATNLHGVTQADR